MHRIILGYSLLTAVAAIFTLGMSAQSTTPFVAEQTIVGYDIGLSGQATVTSIIAGTISRSSDGTTMWRHHTIANGQTSDDEGLLSMPDGTVVRIFWEKKQAVTIKSGGTGSAPAFAGTVGPAKTINGVDCVLAPIHLKVCLPGGPCKIAQPDPNDINCVSPRYGVIVHRVLLDPLASLFPATGRKNHEIVEDTYAFQFVEPDPATMKIPEGFAVVPPAGTSPATNKRRQP